MSVRVQRETFDIGGEIAALTSGMHAIGAVASFVGLVRDVNAGNAGVASVSAMTLEHYPGMTERALEEIVDAARKRWQIMAVRVIHRYGRLEPGDPIVLVIVAGAHRGEAFAACEVILDDDRAVAREPLICRRVEQASVRRIVADLPRAVRDGFRRRIAAAAGNGNAEHRPARAGGQQQLFDYRLKWSHRTPSFGPRSSNAREGLQKSFPQLAPALSSDETSKPRHHRI